jgi:DNA-binding transcriptional MocR family regulator
MTAPQGEPYHVALATLRDRVRTGALPPGARAAAVELADELGLSTTPVREALSRLAGEGLLEDRRGQGYFVPLLSAADVADLYRMSLAHLLIALEPRRLPRARPQGSADAATVPAPAAPDPVEAVERLFRAWVTGSGSRRLIAAFRSLQVQLGPVRRLEPVVIADLAAEAARLTALSEASRAEKLSGLRHFHSARIREADRLAALLETASQDARK